jgi:hypothetical protein
MDRAPRAHQGRRLRETPRGLHESARWRSPLDHGRASSRTLRADDLDVHELPARNRDGSHSVR